MACCVSAGDDSKYLKLHDREPENRKYPETKRRIKKVRRQLEKFEDENPQAKKRVNMIRRQIHKLEHKLDKPGSDDDDVLDDINTDYVFMGRFYKRGTYDLDSSDIYTRRHTRQSARIAIGYFNKESPIRYYVEDFIRATQHHCAGHKLTITFTAKPEGSQEAKTFEAKVFHAIGHTKVEYVKIVDT